MRKKDNFTTCSLVQFFKKGKRTVFSTYCFINFIFYDSAFDGFAMNFCKKFLSHFMILLIKAFSTNITNQKLKFNINDFK